MKGMRAEVMVSVNAKAARTARRRSYPITDCTRMVSVRAQSVIRTDRFACARNGKSATMAGAF